MGRLAGRGWTRSIVQGRAELAGAPMVVDEEPPLGAHLVTPRRGYSHHGIYVGNGRVVHYAGLCRSLNRGPVEEAVLQRFAAGRSVWIKPCPCPRFEGEEAVRRARSRLGENRYRLLTNNCEHFCAWCLFGRNQSTQVEAWLMWPRAAMLTVVALLKALRGRPGNNLGDHICPV